MTNEETRKLQEHLVNTFFIHTCLNCENWRNELGKCVKFDVLPPPEVIVFSCGDHWETRIPF